MLGVIKAGRASRVLASRAALITPARGEWGEGMLDLYPFILETLTLLRASVDGVVRRDSDLGRQLRRALTSVPLKARYHTALGSAREALACFEVAEAMGLAPPLDDQLRDRFERIIRTLSKLRR